MATLIIEHLDARDLPDEWARQLAVDGAQKVTVRIETEAPETKPGGDPAFGMWADHPASADVTAFVDGLRRPRGPDVPAEGELGT
jgi:hypothetical protein